MDINCKRGLIMTRKTVWSVLLLLFISFSFLSAAGTVEAQSALPETRTATDSTGVEVSVPPAINRIAIVGKAALIPADALFLFETPRNAEVTMAKTNQGLGDFFSFLLDEPKDAERLGQTVGAEEILALNPDLILTKERNRASFASLIEPFGIPLYSLDLESADSWKEEILQLGELLGETGRSGEIVDFFTAKEKHVTDRTTGSERPRVLVLQATSGDGITSFSVAPKSWIQNEIIRKAGGDAVTPESAAEKSGWSVVSFEQISAWDPDVIIIVSYRTGGSLYVDQILTSPLWESLSAVQSGDVYAAPSDFVNYLQSDSRWILGLQWLASTIHPQHFSDIDLDEQVRDFYRSLYGIEEETKLDELVNRFNDSQKR